MNFLINMILAVSSWVVFILVIIFVDYPKTLPTATTVQLIAFFLPFFLSISLTINLIFKNLPSSMAFSLGIILLLILKTLQAINSLSVILILLAIVLLISYFKGPHQPQPKTAIKNLTSHSFMPKLKNLRRKK
jgi:hypothetical protein